MMDFVTGWRYELENIKSTNWNEMLSYSKKYFDKDNFMRVRNAIDAGGALKLVLADIGDYRGPIMSSGKTQLNDGQEIGVEEILYATPEKAKEWADRHNLMIGAFESGGDVVVINFFHRDLYTAMRNVMPTSENADYTLSYLARALAWSTSHQECMAMRGS